MKLLLIIATIFLIQVARSQQGSGIYADTVTGANLQPYLISNYQGQMVWFVILPSTQTSADTAFLARIDSVALAQAGQVKTIVVPSYEDGYMADSANTLLNWYAASLDSSIIISQPLYTHIASGSQQSTVFNWLTHSTSNGHFDTDVAGTGSMFFIDANGNLVGVFSPQTMWSNKALNMMFP